MKLLKDLQSVYTKDNLVIEQLTNEFGNYELFEQEYNEFFNEDYINQVIKESSNGSGHIAGAGPVDYNEGKILYIHIRINKPKLILECGTASGCSSVIIAKALEMNGEGKLHTVDISTDNYEAGIQLFRDYVNKGIIETKFGVDAIEYIIDNNFIKYDMSFIDADHAYKFCFDLVSVLYKYYPTIPHYYHEWSLSSLSENKEKEYVSFDNHIGHMFERNAFEDIFPSSLYEFKGFYGSCGLGLVRPKSIKVFYRLSSKNAFVSKNKIHNADKLSCLNNIISIFGKNNLYIQADNCSNEVINILKELKVNFNITDSSSPSESFIILLETIIQLNDDDLIYVVEDDYLHLPNSDKILFEGFTTGADYITLYDHPDKYIDADKGGNAYIESGGEVTRLLLTKSCHWKFTNSTCLTFATKVKHIKDDFETWKKYVYEVPSLGSFYAFINIRDQKNKILISSIPGYSTHTEIKWLSPLTNWKTI